MGIPPEVTDKIVALGQQVFSIVKTTFSKELANLGAEDVAVLEKATHRLAQVEMQRIQGVDVTDDEAWIATTLEILAVRNEIALVRDFMSVLKTVIQQAISTAIEIAAMGLLA